MYSVFAIVNLSSNFVIEHFRSTDFHTVLYTCIYIQGVAAKFRLFSILNILEMTCPIYVILRLYICTK